MANGMSTSPAELLDQARATETQVNVILSDGRKRVLCNVADRDPSGRYLLHGEGDAIWVHPREVCAIVLAGSPKAGSSTSWCPDYASTM